MAVKAVLDNLNIPYNVIELGRVELTEPLRAEQYDELSLALLQYELEIIKDKKKILVERIKNLITEMIQCDSDDPPLKFSAYLGSKLGYNYTYIANIFSASENITIERYYIMNRIEKVKELMVYEEMSIKEIAYQLRFSSVSHLCLQFKKVTGEIPSAFKKLCQSPEYVWKKRAI
jgi:AraC-like DNA-binding protein